MRAKKHEVERHDQIGGDDGDGDQEEDDYDG